MQVNLVKWFLLLFLIHELQGSRILWKLNAFAPLEKTVKTMLESCYENDSSSNPILILGDFNEFIENSSIIRLNDLADATFLIKKPGQFEFKASRIVIVENPSERLYSDLKILGDMDCWNHMTSFFIISKSRNGCKDFKKILNAAWSGNMINLIYICAESMNIPVLYSLNSMANYAPYPWERMEKLKDLNVFRQVFDHRISCKNLNFDKTRHLNGYEIEVVGNRERNLCLFPPRNNCELEDHFSFKVKSLQSIITAINASARFEDGINSKAIRKLWIDDKLDITGYLWDLSMTPRGSCFLLPYIHINIIGVVKLKSEVTTLLKISKLWSTPVLIAAAIALAFLFLILIIKNLDFGLAMLDIVRLLTYTSIRTSDQTHAFRIYFTTMLIFMVISNGVFQGKIAAFLTTRERGSAMETIEELADLGYKMFTVENSDWLNEKCPKCDFKRTSPRQCIEQVLNNTHHLCATWERIYHAEYSKSELDYIPKALINDFKIYGCRKHWPLQNRFSDGLSRLFQTGILDFWLRSSLEVPKRKRMAREAEWSSTQYRPIKLYKLTFAFQVLALGLSISTVVFIWELFQGKYGTTRESSIVQPTRRNPGNCATNEMLVSLRYRRSIILNGYFSKYPLTIRQDYMSHVGKITQSINDDTYRARKFTVFRKNISSLQSFPKNSK